MATHENRILEYLAEHPAGADDDELSTALGITQRQTVNAICNRLAASRGVVRERDQVRGKIVNRIGAGVTPPAPVPTATQSIPIVAGGLVELRDADEVLRFAYGGEVNLAEDSVTVAVKGVLERQGWTVAVKLGHAQGIDIDARRGSERLILESKGEGTLSAMRVNFFLGALGELLQRMETPDARYGVALPAHRQLVRLVIRLPQWVRERLDLCFYLVRPAGDGLEVGYIPPGAHLLER